MHKKEKFAQMENLYSMTFDQIGDKKRESRSFSISSIVLLPYKFCVDGTMGYEGLCIFG